jgi:hypothetical protein
MHNQYMVQICRSIQEYITKASNHIKYPYMDIQATLDMLFNPLNRYRIAFAKFIMVTW